MHRSYPELLASAMTLRQRLLREQREPTDSTFTLTATERMTLLDQPFTSVIMNHSQQRFCGFKLHEISV